MSVGQLETSLGDAWPGSFNIGAVQLRSLTSDEHARFMSGALKAGDSLPDHSGVLHVDTHPPGIPYPVWFAAFPTRQAGAAYFLKTLDRLSASEWASPTATPSSLATAMYVHHFYEGRHVDDRPWMPARTLPLTPPEQANVEDYAAGIARCLAMVTAGCSEWPYGAAPSTTDT
jgi:hypothetical protein